MPKQTTMDLNVFVCRLTLGGGNFIAKVRFHSATVVSSNFRVVLLALISICCGSARGDDKDARTKEATPEFDVTTSTAQSGVQSTAVPPIDAVPITLEAAIREALTHAPEMAAATENIAQAQADYKTASLLPNPQLTLGTSLQALPGTRFTPSNPGGPPQYNVDISAPIDSLIFGKRAAAMKSAGKTIDVASAHLTELQRQRIAGVAAAFFDVLEAAALVDLSRRDLESLRRVETLTQKRRDLGGSAPIDVERAHLAVVAATQNARSVETAHAVTLTRLRGLLGRHNPTQTLEIAGALAVTHPRKPPDLDSVLNAAEEDHPTIIALRRDIEHWEAEVRSQKRQAYPTASVQLGYIYQEQAPVGLRNLDEWEASTSLSVPIFDRNQGNIAKSASQLRQARDNLAAARVALQAELTKAFAEYRDAYAALVADDPSQLATAKSVRDRMEASYQAGGRTMLEVLDAEQVYREAIKLHVHAQSNYWHTYYQLRAAAGTAFNETSGGR